MEILALFAILLVLAVPVLAIVAYVNVQRLTEQLAALRIPDLISRVFTLEQRLSALEKVLKSQAAPDAPMPQPETPPQALEKPLELIAKPAALAVPVVYPPLNSTESPKP